VKTIFSGWLEDLKGHPGDGGFLRTYCSQTCADRADVPARRLRWPKEQPGLELKGLCSLCGSKLREETRPDEGVTS
jgi:hypothetical protein